MLNGCMSPLGSKCWGLGIGFISIRYGKMATPKFQISFPTKSLETIYEAIMQGSLASWKKNKPSKMVVLKKAQGPPGHGTVSSPGAPIAWRLRPMAAMLCKMGRFTFLWKKVSLYLHVNTCKYTDTFFVWDYEKKSVGFLSNIKSDYNWSCFSWPISKQNIGPLELQRRLPIGAELEAVTPELPSWKKTWGFPSALGFFWVENPWKPPRFSHVFTIQTCSTVHPHKPILGVFATQNFPGPILSHGKT